MAIERSKNTPGTKELKNKEVNPFKNPSLTEQMKKGILARHLLTNLKLEVNTQDEGPKGRLLVRDFKTNEVLGSLPKGAKVKPIDNVIYSKQVNGEEKQFVRIKLPNGKDGFVSIDYLTAKEENKNSVAEGKEKDIDRFSQEDIENGKKMLEILGEDVNKVKNGKFNPEDLLSIKEKFLEFGKNLSVPADKLKKIENKFDEMAKVIVLEKEDGGGFSDREIYGLTGRLLKEMVNIFTALGFEKVDINKVLNDPKMIKILKMEAQKFDKKSKKQD